MCRDRKAHILTGRVSLAPALRVGGRGVPFPQPGPSYQEGQALGGVPDSSFYQQGHTSVGPCHCSQQSSLRTPCRPRPYMFVMWGLFCRAPGDMPCGPTLCFRAVTLFYSTHSLATLCQMSFCTPQAARHLCGQAAGMECQPRDGWDPILK